MPPFLDANVLIRHLTGDDPEKAGRCFALIQAIEQGRQTVWTSDLVILEIVFVLSSRNLYNIPREAIRDALLPIINLSGLKLPNKRLYARAFDYYCSLPIDFPDAYHAALMESRREREIYSYDTDFDRVPGVTRLEP